jgi:hypothetical protein
MPKKTQQKFESSYPEIMSEIIKPFGEQLTPKALKEPVS